MIETKVIATLSLAGYTPTVKPKTIGQPGFLASTLLAASLALPAIAQSNKPNVIEFDVPGAGTVSSPACANALGCGTVAFANNDLGVIVGFYTDANVVAHGFLRAPDGNIISFDVPGAGLGVGLDQGTFAYCINDLGAIAEAFEDSSSVYHGFLRAPDGSFTTFDAPGAGTGANQGTCAWSLNLHGTTAGTYIDGNNVTHGFVRSRDNEIAQFDPPDSVLTYPCEETCLGPDGTVIGFYNVANGTSYGFVRTPDGKIAKINAPGAATGYGTIAASISQDGTIGGYFGDANFEAHGFVRCARRQVH